MKSKYFSFIFIGLVVLYSLILLFPLFHSGFFPIHDDTQVARVNQMTKAIKDGMFPVRWVSDLGYGYGYPIFNFYAPFAYYVGSGVNLIGFDELVSTKVMIAVSFFLLGIGMYLLSSRIFGKIGGFISSVLILSSPYLAVNLYVRGAVSELYGIAFVPLVFYSVIQIATMKKFRYVILGSLSFAGMVISHNLTTLMVTPFILILFCLFFLISLRLKQNRAIVFLVCMFFIGVLLSAFYWIPAIFEINYTNVRSQVGGGADFRKHYICPFQLWDSPWGFGGSTASCVDGMSFRLGKLYVLLLAMVFPLILISKKSAIRISLIGGYVVFVGAAFLSLSVSRPVWEFIKPLEFIQYPWRYLGLMSLSAAFLSGGVAVYPRLFFTSLKTQRIALLGLVVAIIGITMLFYSKLFTPQVFLDVTAQDYVLLDTIHFKTSTLSDEYLPVGFKKPTELRFIPKEPIEVLSGDVFFDPKQVTTDYLLINAVSDTESSVHINTAYYPAWHVLVDGKEIVYKKDKTGMVFDLPQGSHMIEVVYKSTSFQMLGNVLSIVGIGALIIGIILEHKRKLL